MPLFRSLAIILLFGFTSSAATSAHRYMNGDDLIENAIRDEALIFEREILKESDTGRTILQLKREKEELLDTVWLATSPVQIRKLWKNFKFQIKHSA